MASLNTSMSAISLLGAGLHARGGDDVRSDTASRVFLAPGAARWASLTHATNAAAGIGQWCSADRADRVQVVGLGIRLWAGRGLRRRRSGRGAGRGGPRRLLGAWILSATICRMRGKSGLTGRISGGAKLTLLSGRVRPLAARSSMVADLAAGQVGGDDLLAGLRDLVELGQHGHRVELLDHRVRGTSAATCARSRWNPRGSGRTRARCSRPDAGPFLVRRNP